MRTWSITCSRPRRPFRGSIPLQASPVPYRFRRRARAKRIDPAASAPRLPSVRVGDGRQLLDVPFARDGRAADVPTSARRGEPFGETAQLLRDVVAGHLQAVTGGYHSGLQFGESLDALVGALPIGGEGGRRAAQLSPAGEVHAPRVKVHGGESVGSQQHAVGRAVKGDVPRSVAERVHPAPARKARYAAVGGSACTRSPKS